MLAKVRKQVLVLLDPLLKPHAVFFSNRLHLHGSSPFDLAHTTMLSPRRPDGECRRGASVVRSTSLARPGCSGAQVLRCSGSFSPAFCGPVTQDTDCSPTARTDEPSWAPLDLVGVVPTNCRTVPGDGFVPAVLGPNAVDPVRQARICIENNLSPVATDVHRHDSHLGGIRPTSQRRCLGRRMALHSATLCRTKSAVPEVFTMADP